MRKVLLLLLFAVTAVVQSVAIDVKFCGNLVTDYTDIKSEFAKAYDSNVGNYYMWIDKYAIDGMNVYFLRLRNALVEIEGGSAFEVFLDSNERLVVDVLSTSKITAPGVALFVSSPNNETDVEITGATDASLMLESTGSNVIHLMNSHNGCNIHLHAHLQVSNTTSPAEDKRAAIYFDKPGALYVDYDGYLKAKSNYAASVGANVLMKPDDVPANFVMSWFEEEGVYAPTDPATPDVMKTTWCYVNNYDIPAVKVAGTQVTYADSWGDSGIESPYITGGSVKYTNEGGIHVISLNAATIDIPEEVTDVPGIFITEGTAIVIQRLNPGSEGNRSTINVPGGDGIRILSSGVSPVDLTEITQDNPAYLQYLNINAKTGIRIENQSGMPNACHVTRTLKLNIEAETGVYVWGDFSTEFHYAGDVSSEMHLKTTGKAIVLGNDNGTGTDAYFEGDGKFDIDSDGDGLSLYDATVHFTDNIYVAIKSNAGAAINGNQSMAFVKKESKDSYVWLMGKTGAINDVYGLVFNADCGEIVQNEEADDATMEKLNAPFWTYVKNGKPYTNVAELRFVEKYFQIGDYVLNDKNYYYFDKKIPGVDWNPYEKVLTLKDAKIKATGENIGLMPLFSAYDAMILLEGENVIEAEGIALQNDKCNMTIWSKDGKGKLAVKSTAEKGVYNLNSYSLLVHDCAFDVTAEKEAVWNEEGYIQVEECEGTFAGKGGGYRGAQPSSQITLYRAFITCVGSEVDGNINPSFWGYNYPLLPPEELLSSGYDFDETTNYPEIWVYKKATGQKTGEPIQFGVEPDNLYYEIIINGIDVNATNCASIQPPALKSGKISYDPVERELILDNVEMDGASIYINTISKCERVKLVGENRVEGASGVGLYFENIVPVTIYSEDGNGRLIAKGSADAYPCAFNLSADLTIKNCGLDIVCEDKVGLSGNGYKLTIEKADVSFFGKTGSIVGLADLYKDYETSIVAPEGAEFNMMTGNVEVDNVVVADEAVVFHYAKQYAIYIGSEVLTADDLDDFRPAGVTSGKVSYDPEQNVLTLNNATLKECLAVQTDEPATIMLVGSNKIKTNSNALTAYAPFTIKSADGSGVLSTQAEYYVVNMYSDLTVENCKLTAACVGSIGYGVNVDGVLTVNNATLRAEGTPSLHASKGLVLGEGMEITDPAAAYYNKISGDIEINGEATDYEVTIGKPATLATTVPVKVTSVGAAGFSSSKSLDFTGLPVSAWISTGMRNGNIMLGRVFKVAAGTGVYLKGKKGEEITCEVPIIEDDSYYANMFVGVPAGKKIEEKEGTIMIPDYYQTYFFAKSNTTQEPTFYPTTSEGKELGQNKMYMRMPVTVDPNAQTGEPQEETVEVTVSKAGAAGFSCDKALDFTDSKISAWIATGFSGGNILLSRVFAVPANTGVYLKGKAGEEVTAQIPVTTEKPYYRNFFQPTGPNPVTISSDEFDYEVGIYMHTFYFALDKTTNQPTFYPTDPATGKDLGGNKMYLCLPAALVPSASRTIGLEFLDDDVIETTGISEASPFENEKMRNGEDDGEHQSSEKRGGVYDLQGRRIQTSNFKVETSNLKKGVYIQNGRKVIKQ